MSEPRPAPAGPEVVITTLMRADGGSGVQSHVRTVRDYLDSVSRPVSVLSPFSSSSPLLWPAFGARLAIRTVVPSAGVWWYRHWHAHFLGHALKAHLATPRSRVLYAQCPVSAEVALRTRTTQRVVMAVHFNVSQADEWAAKGEIPWNGSLFRSIRASEDRVLPQLDGIVYVSAFMRDVLEARLPVLRQLPAAVIPNSVTSRPSTCPPPLADLITVGALQPHKNHAYLLEILAVAARRGHRYTLTVVGAGPERSSLEALARRLGLAVQVRFLGYQPDPRSLMGGHRIYCHTSMMESFGIVLIEAMAEGLPVLAAAVGGVPEIVRPGQDGAFWPLDDPAAAADALIDLMEDTDRRGKMAEEARARAADFSTDVLGGRLLSFLDTLRVPQARAAHRLEPERPILPDPG